MVEQAPGGTGRRSRARLAVQIAVSTPISEMITRAAVRPTPLIASSRSTAWAKGAISSSSLRSSSAMSVSSRSTRASILVSKNPCKNP